MEPPPGAEAPAWKGSIRPLTAPDLGTVAALEALCNPQPWGAEALKAYVAGVGRVSLVAVLDGTVVGYVIATCVADEAEILILGVHPDARRGGIARALLTDLLGRLKAAGAGSVFLEVRRGNRPAIALYESLGFGEAGVRKGYYSDTGEDALLLHVFLKR
jgi:ribosomal-protein-alanine N-acetyltransferase